MVFGGPLSRELLHFAMNYSGGLFLKILFSQLRKQGNFTWRNFLLRIVSQTFILLTDNPSKFTNFIKPKSVAIT